MKLISWNVNGFRACLGKGFAEFFKDADADIFCIQETKMQPGQADFETPGYYQYWYSAEKKGYSGTAVFCRTEPLSVRYGIGIPEHDTEGRAITLEFEDFYFLCVYTPNAQRELARLDYRMSWEDALRGYITELDRVKPVVYCGDLNVAHEEIDLKNPKTNHNSAGFSDEERTRPVDGSERYNIYSCSKPITCTAALQLLEKGLIGLDTPVYEYLPEFRQMKKCVDSYAP